MYESIQGNELIFFNILSKVDIISQLNEQSFQTASAATLTGYQNHLLNIAKSRME